MCFQAKVAALVCLTAACIGLTEGYFLILGPQINAKGSGFKADKVPELLIGKIRDFFYLHSHSSAIDMYYIQFQITGFYKLIFWSCPTVCDVRIYNKKIKNEQFFYGT